jgi:hypothetical protein
VSVTLQQRLIEPMVAVESCNSPGIAPDHHDHSPITTIQKPRDSPRQPPTTARSVAPGRCSASPLCSGVSVVARRCYLAGGVNGIQLRRESISPTSDCLPDARRGVAHDAEFRPFYGRRAGRGGDCGAHGSPTQSLPGFIRYLCRSKTSWWNRNNENKAH